MMMIPIKTVVEQVCEVGSKILNIHIEKTLGNRGCFFIGTLQLYILTVGKWPEKSVACDKLILMNRWNPFLEEAGILNESCLLLI